MRVCTLPTVFLAAVFKDGAEADLGVLVGEMLRRNAQHPGQAVVVLSRFASALPAAGCPGPQPFPGVELTIASNAATACCPAARSVKIWSSAMRCSRLSGAVALRVLVARQLVPGRRALVRLRAISG